MATSDTGSSLAQWSSGLYHYEASSLGHADGGATADSTAAVVASAPAAAAVTSPTSAGPGGGGSSPTRTPRVGKPASAARKRSRASRRAPVTLLNTDTANFRAMVQQFTGIPAPSPFAGPGGGGAPVINFANDYGFPPPSSVMSVDHLHHQQRQQQQQTFQDHLLLRPPQLHHQHQQQYTGAVFGYSSNMQQALANGADVFAHGLGSAEDRMLLQSMQAAQQIMPAASTTANHSANGFFA